MKAFWRDDDSRITSYADWLGQIGAKNRVPGTSAPTLATAWSGPIELFGALARQEALAGFVVEGLFVEAQTHFDPYAGPRNHDALLTGRLPDGARVVVCVEAKADESLGQTVEQYARAASTKRTRRENTDAPERLERLLARYVPWPATEPRVLELRYQLLAALAGAEAAAAAEGAEHAVLLIHEFRTDGRPGTNARRNEADLRRFVTTVFGEEPPPDASAPWCIGLPVSQDSEPTRPALYLAKAVTDLRSETLRSG